MLVVGLLIVLAAVAVLAVCAVRRVRGLESALGELRASGGNDRQAFIEHLELELLRTDRTGRPAALAVLGAHEAELTEVAAAIRGAVRRLDRAYRIGAAEFALILPETRARGALIALKRVDQRLLAATGQGATLTAGIAEVGPGSDCHQLFRDAYCALLAAGRDGRSRILAYSPELELTGDLGDLAGIGEIEALDESSM